MGEGILLLRQGVEGGYAHFEFYLGGFVRGNLELDCSESESESASLFGVLFVRSSSSQLKAAYTTAAPRSTKSSNDLAGNGRVNKRLLTRCFGRGN